MGARSCSFFYVCACWFIFWGHLAAFLFFALWGLCDCQLFFVEHLLSFPMSYCVLVDFIFHKFICLDKGRGGGTSFVPRASPFVHRQWISSFIILFLSCSNVRWLGKESLILTLKREEQWCTARANKEMHSKMNSTKSHTHAFFVTSSTLGVCTTQ